MYLGIGLTESGFCDGTVIRAIQSAWDKLENKSELYMAAAAVDAIKKLCQGARSASPEAPTDPLDDNFQTWSGSQKPETGAK